MLMILKACSLEEIEDSENYVEIIKENFGNLGGDFYKYNYLEKERILYCDGLYSVIFYHDREYLNYGILVMDENYNLDYASLDEFNFSLKDGHLMTWDSPVYETIDFCKKKDSVGDDYDSSIIYIQINSLTGEELVMAYEWNDRGAYNRLYTSSLKEPYSLAFLQNKKLQKYVLVKAEQGLLAYDVMTIKDYGMTEFLKNGMYSLNREKGYNLRYDSEGKCYCSKETSQKITNRLKKEWKSGIRDGHSDKLKEYWENCGEERKKQQSEIMSKNKTKYIYIIYDPNGKLITENGNYNTLKELNLHNAAPSMFSRKKCDEVICKKYKIIRKKINKDIVQPNEKSLE